MGRGLFDRSRPAAQLMLDFLDKRQQRDWRQLSCGGTSYVQETFLEGVADRRCVIQGRYFYQLYFLRQGLQRRLQIMFAVTHVRAQT